METPRRILATKTIHQIISTTIIIIISDSKTNLKIIVITTITIVNK
jgi:hypothetical protein